MNNPVVLTEKNTTYGVRFVDYFSYVNGPKVPIYEVFTMNALNQIIGHAKFGNRLYGNVYYRGVTELYDNALPSIFRKRVSGKASDLRKKINTIFRDPYFQGSLKVKPVQYNTSLTNNYLINTTNRNTKYIIEGLIQHYSGNTRFLDVVDNHWVALWMGLHKCQYLGRGNRYCRYERRIIPVQDFVVNCISAPIGRNPSTDSIENQAFLYVLLLAMPEVSDSIVPGIKESDYLVEVDLRRVLPSVYVRPHAQHALVVRKRDGNLATDYDMSSQIVGILKIRLDYAALWLGNGTLLTQDNLFPPPAVDQGYDNLLQKIDIFSHPFEIIHYF